MAHRSQIGIAVLAIVAASAWVSLVRASVQETLASSGVYTTAQADRGMNHLRQPVRVVP